MDACEFKMYVHGCAAQRFVGNPIEPHLMDKPVLIELFSKHLHFVSDEE